MARTADNEVESRRRKILFYIEKNLYVSVKDLSLELGVSEITIRRDLQKLTEKGAIDRPYGGAKIKDQFKLSAQEVDKDKSQLLPFEEQYVSSLAEVAVSQINFGDVIILSFGPISQKIAGLLSEKSDITVITNSMKIYNILKNFVGIHLLLTGGELHHRNDTLIGPLAESSIQGIRVDKYFLEPSGIANDFKLYCHDLAEYSIQLAMIQVAREIIIIADNSKFNNKGLKQIGELNIASKILLSSNINPEIVNKITKQEIEIVNK